MLQQLTFVDSFLLIIVFDLPAVRGKFSCKNIPKFTARPELGRTPRRAVHATTRGFYYAKSLLEDLGTPGVPRLPVPDVY